MVPSVLQIERMGQVVFFRVHPLLGAFRGSEKLQFTRARTHSSQAGKHGLGKDVVGWRRMESS